MLQAAPVFCKYVSETPGIKEIDVPRSILLTIQNLINWSIPIKAIHKKN